MVAGIAIAECIIQIYYWIERIALKHALDRDRTLTFTLFYKD